LPARISIKSISGAPDAVNLAMATEEPSTAAFWVINRGRDPGDWYRILFVDSLDMQTFIFRCPITGFRVRGQSPESTNEDKGEHFDPVKCTACKRVHLVNPKTGKLISDK
jgi:hypothetical protein